MFLAALAESQGRRGEGQPSAGGAAQAGPGGAQRGGGRTVGAGNCVQAPRRDNLRYFMLSSLIFLWALASAVAVVGASSPQGRIPLQR